ncbi:MAG: ABC transporter ATP-binding protein [Akkermansiaceae bacterium]|jgi:lipoprotein-releasing system ATP-binding protein|nr:ABC transporter ATP-binding protein [Akkermansiaceae bacterium]
MIELSGLVKTYPAPGGAVEVLRGVGWSVADGEAVAVTGPSGCGKTTLLNILGALDRPDAGEVRIGGEDIAGLDADAAAAFRNRSLGFVFQHHHLLPQLTVLENALVPRLAGGWTETAEESAKRATRLLERLGLAERLDHLPWQLSGGERLRVALARALLNRPRLVLADEPTGMLDPATTDTVGDLLLQINREEGATLVVVTHNPALARRIGRVCELHDGLLKEVSG